MNSSIEIIAKKNVRVYSYTRYKRLCDFFDQYSVPYEVWEDFDNQCYCFNVMNAIPFVRDIDSVVKLLTNCNMEFRLP